MVANPSYREEFANLLDDDDSSGIELTNDGETKSITAVIATFDPEMDTDRRNLYDAMRRVVVEAKRASRLAKEGLRVLELQTTH